MTYSLVNSLQENSFNDKLATALVKEIYFHEIEIDENDNVTGNKQLRAIPKRGVQVVTEE